ncbi:hypothetical protein ACKLNR_004754 [Fusarium oxysporum f. sp. zingiberi]
MNKRLYPVIFFTLERRFPWECETGWAAAQDFRVFDGDNEDPQFKALVDHWLAREDRQTPDEELIRLNRGSSSSSSSDRKSSPEEPLENGDIDEELRKAFVDLTECLSSDRGSSREESPDSDDDESDIGNALLRGARKSDSRHTRSYQSQRRPQHKDTETHHRHRNAPMSPDDGTPAGRPNPDEDEDSDIYCDDNIGPFLDKSPIKGSDTASSRHDLEESSVRSREFSNPIDERTTIPPSDDEYSLGGGGIIRADATGDEEDEEDSI